VLLCGVCFCTGPRLRKGIVSFLILDDPFTRRSRTVENGKQLAIYIRDWRLLIIWSNTQAVEAATQRLHLPLHGMLVLEMSKIMYEVNNLALATIVPSWHSFNFLGLERMILKQPSTDDEIAVESRAADDIITGPQSGNYASLYMIRCWLMKKDVDILLSRMGWCGDAGRKESQEGQNRRSLHNEV
jgi:hypothetical protein